MFYSVILSLALSAAPETSDIDCYDVKIRAKPVAQIPTVYPDDDPEYIVISWPWFVDLKITKVLEGEIRKSQITALAVLHTGYVRKSRIWFLRRNTAGFFNIIRTEPSRLVRCDPDTPAANPYLRPGAGETYESYRRAGEERYKLYGAKE
ncbi:MAG: hypothetical protein WA793_08380 [Sphingorhabdus sp.]|uniref:hypothetical protein n=1 Tax=Sphingorhabdus sp. TaxID=1902408 RepID=UPI003C91471C